MVIILRAVLFLSIFATVAASPAIVWSNIDYGTSNFVHTSDAITSQNLLTDLRLDETKNSSLASVIFLIGRARDGAESLSLLASQNVLPDVASRQDNAQRVYYHVSGIQTTSTFKSETKRMGYASAVVEIEEFMDRLTILETETNDNLGSDGIVHNAIAQLTESKLTRELDRADVLIVNVDALTDPKLIDTAIVRAIDSAAVGTVVLSAIRSVEEVKFDRERLSRRRLEMKRNAGWRASSFHRRLDQVQAQNAGADDNTNQDFSGEYYVSLTPNILAGLLFFLLFSTITYIGIGCMGMISGQDVFATKMPAVGREA